ncbi:MAG: PVC-type heme-binding CxxCH protein [Planctomycetaceae bacterium]
MSIRHLVLAACLAGLAAPLPSRGDEPPADGADYAADLPRIPQTPAAAAAASMRVRPGFALDLAVAEPLLASPVAVAWDEDGRLFVVEMRGYSEDRGENLGRVRLLHDDDRDGTYDRATVFASDLAWPTAVVVWGGGIFVGDAPDVLWLRDADGDGVADERRRVLTGFGTGNVQGLFNSFAFGSDGRIHGAGSSSGGEVRRVGDDGEPVGPAVSIAGRDFSFDPRSLEVRPETGGAQHGRSVDDVGAVFLCHNSDHAIRVMVDDRFLARNPFFAAPAAKESVAIDGPQAAVFRESPVEPWRVLRTRLRASGIVPGIVEGGGRPAGYFTSATGITVVRGDRCGDLAGMLVVGDVGSNLVHRKRLLPHGAGVRAERVDEGCELVASTDTWFRPVQFAGGPDGALWIIDMQREVIEHPASLAPPIKRHLDLTSGRDTGRLWRLVAVPEGAGPDAARATRRGAPRLSVAPAAELVRLLGHADGWHRDTAARLLVERRDPGALGALRGAIADAAAPPLARIHAAHVLDALGTLEADDLLPLLDAPEAAPREAGVRLAEGVLARGGAGVDRLVARLRERAAVEPRVEVRFALALVAGGLPDAARREVVRICLERDGADPWCRFAAFTSLAGDAGAIVEAWLADPARLAARGPAAAIAGLVAQVGRRHDAAELSRIVAGIGRLAADPAAGAADTRPLAAAADTRPLATALAVELAGALETSGAALAAVAPAEATAALVARLAEHCRGVALDRRAEPAARIRAIRGLRLADDAARVLGRLVVAEEPTEVVRAAIDALGRSRDPAAGAALVAAIPGLSPEGRGAAAAALSRDAAGAGLLLDAIVSGALPAADLERQTAAALWAFPDAAVVARAIEALGPPPPADREALVASYRASLPQDGDREQGRGLFRKHCMACHRVEGEGRETGPALAAVQARGAEAMLLAVLDPNREVLPAYLAHAAVTADGRVVTGVVAAQSEGSVTLRTAEGDEVTIPRDDLESLTNTKRSLMPEGFEKSIDARGMADLLAYLMSAR